jgi:hypothetical protein
MRGPMKLLYVVVPVLDDVALFRVRLAVARPWLQAYRQQVRYWVPSVEEAENECAVLALAGFSAEVEGLDPAETENWQPRLATLYRGPRGA